MLDRYASGNSQQKRYRGQMDEGGEKQNNSRIGFRERKI
jgi:hypothetical protein